MVEIIFFSESEFIHGLAVYLLVLMISATIMSTIALLVTRLLRDRSLLTTTAVLRGVTVGLLLIPIVPFVGVRVITGESEPVIHTVTYQPSFFDIHSGTVETTSASYTKEEVENAISNQRVELRRERISVETIMVSLWALVTSSLVLIVFLQMILLVGMRFLTKPVDNEQWLSSLKQWRLKMGIFRAVRLVEADQCKVPSVLGGLFPLIVLPKGFAEKASPEERDAILVHELAHIRRGDFSAQLQQKLAEALYWPVPMVWMVGREVAALRERACDEYAVYTLQDKVPYRATLAELVTAFVPGNRFGIGIAMLRRGGVADRLRALEFSTGLRDCRARWIVRAGCLAVIVASSFLSGCLIFRKEIQAPAPRPDAAMLSKVPEITEVSGEIISVRVVGTDSYQESSLLIPGKFQKRRESYDVWIEGNKGNLQCDVNFESRDDGWDMTINSLVRDNGTFTLSGTVGKGAKRLMGSEITAVSGVLVRWLFPKDSQALRDMGLLEFETTTQQRGEFSFPTIIRDEISGRLVTRYLVAEAEGFAPHIERISIENRMWDSSNIVLYPSTTSKGRVVNYDGTPMEGVVIGLHSLEYPDGTKLLTAHIPEGTLATTVVTDSNGEWRIDNLPEGGTASVTFDTRSTESILPGTSFTINSFEVMRIARKAASITGSISTTIPFDRDRIALSLGNGRRAEWLSPTEFRFSGVSSGTYRLKLDDRDKFGNKPLKDLSVALLESPVVNVAEGETVTISEPVQVVEAAKLTVYCIDAKTGAPTMPFGFKVERVVNSKIDPTDLLDEEDARVLYLASYDMNTNSATMWVPKNAVSYIRTWAPMGSPQVKGGNPVEVSVGEEDEYEIKMVFESPQ